MGDQNADAQNDENTENICQHENVRRKVGLGDR
jgi:hypothetical protein